MHQPPPPMSSGYGNYTVSANAIANLGKSEQDNESNKGQYSPSKPTCTPTKFETSVSDPVKVESKGKHKMDQKCSKTICHDIIWIFDRLLMGILKFS